MRARLAAALAFVGLVAGAADARAFCRSRTCNPYDPKQQCELVNGNCVVTGAELWWRSSCVTFDAQADGSTLRGIDANTVADVVGRAFQPWLAANCGSGTPSMKAGSFGPVECDEPENPDPKQPNRYNRRTEKGANVVMFRDDGWPYQGAEDAYALTTVTFDPDSGEIFDADIEINSTDFNVTVDGSGADLQTILTHEVGHFLGMAHTPDGDQTSTMRPHWNGVGTDLRTLSPDDMAGICDAYPPNRSAPSDCEPLNGFTSDCHVPKDKEDSGGCAFAAPRPHPRGSTPWLMAGGLLAARVLRRRRRARPSVRQK